MANEPDRPLTAKGLQFWGLFAIAIGAMIMLVAAGMLPSKGEQAPAWVVACAASIFVLAGGLLVLRSFMGGDTNDRELPPSAPFWLRTIYYVAGLGIVAALATIGTWVAFGPGERAFSIAIPFSAAAWQTNGSDAPHSVSGPCWPGSSSLRRRRMVAKLARGERTPSS